MKLFGWPSDEGACRFYRLTNPFGALAALGHDAPVVTPKLSGSELIDLDADPDRLIVLSRSYHQEAAAAMAHFYGKGRPFVFDVDDHLWAVEPDNPAAEIYGRSEVRAVLDWMILHAALVTTSTPELADAVAKARRQLPIEVLPNSLPKSLIAPLTEERSHTILWRGSDTHRRDVAVVGYALRKAEAAGHRIVLAGADYRRLLGLKRAELLDDLLLSDDRWRETAQAQRVKRAKKGEIDLAPRRVWLTPADYLRAISDVVRPTIAVCPLRRSEFNDSKSHIAAMEAHAVGAVPVASDVPPFARYLSGGGGVLVPNVESEWWTALSDLLTASPTDLRSIVKAGTETALSFCSEAVAPAYEAAYSAI